MGWREQAACRGMGADMFVLDKGDARDVAKAKAVCARCEVTEECYEEAETPVYIGGVHAPTLGVWAGMSGKDRRNLRLRRESACA